MKCVEKYDFCMDTVVYQKVYGKNTEEVIDEATRKIRYLEGKLSFFQEESDIFQINIHAGKNWVKVSQDTIDVLQKAVEVSKSSNGAFDVTVGVLTDYWRQLKKNQKKPDKNQIQDLISLINYRDILINSEERLVKLLWFNQKIDLGGIGKGYAGEKVIDVYKDYSIQSGFINLGGNVVTIGKTHWKRSWIIGIRNPFSADGGIFGNVQVQDRAVVTSGGYERYYEIDGLKYHHILDPRTGFPARLEWQSVTIVEESSTLADALSTAIFIMNRQELIRFLKNFPSLGVILVAHTGEIMISKNLKEIFQKTNPEMSIIYID
jgi:thiamine biosynthesis lipoprotein